MRRFIVLCIFCVVSAQPIWAGAWLRDQGKGFTSTSSTLWAIKPVTEYAISLYAEYGLSERFTIGLDINEIPGVGGHVLTFLRTPIPLASEHAKLALELGVGGHHRNTDWFPMYRAGVSWGKGFSGMFGAGWMAVESAAEYRTGDLAVVYKLDATIGLSSSRRIRPLLQLETALIKGQPLQWTLTPSLMIGGKEGTTWVIGLQRRSFGTRRTGIKLSLWRQF